MKEADLGPLANIGKQEILDRLAHFREAMAVLEEQMREAAKEFPQVEALLSIRGIGLYTALVIVAELGEPGRFKNRREVGAYAGLTPRVRQSGSTERRGHISRQGPSLLRWVLVQAAMMAHKHDPPLQNFYQRVRKRSSAKIARVALARKLAIISWVRLRHWEQERRAA